MSQRTLEEIIDYVTRNLEDAPAGPLRTGMEVVRATGVYEPDRTYPAPNAREMFLLEALATEKLWPVLEEGLQNTIHQIPSGISGWTNDYILNLSLAIHLNSIDAYRKRNEAGEISNLHSLNDAVGLKVAERLHALLSSSRKSDNADSKRDTAFGHILANSGFGTAILLALIEANIVVFRRQFGKMTQRDLTDIIQSETFMRVALKIALKDKTSMNSLLANMGRGRNFTVTRMNLPIMRMFFDTKFLSLEPMQGELILSAPQEYGEELYRLYFDALEKESNSPLNYGCPARFAKAPDRKMVLEKFSRKVIDLAVTAAPFLLQAGG